MTGFREAMPMMLRHEGVWEGEYRHIDRDGSLADFHFMTTRCAFPAEGPHVYIQHNTLRWPDGRTVERSFPGSFEDGRLRWDTDRFSGFGWETEAGIVMLRLDRKDEPGVRFTEMIELSDDGQTRARTWQWFRDGVPFRRTLCDEWRTEGASR